jgi:hypothetical protein
MFTIQTACRPQIARIGSETQGSFFFSFLIKLKGACPKHGLMMVKVKHGSGNSHSHAHSRRTSTSVPRSFLSQLARVARSAEACAANSRGERCLFVDVDGDWDWDGTEAGEEGGQEGAEGPSEEVRNLLRIADERREKASIAAKKHGTWHERTRAS